MAVGQPDALGLAKMLQARRFDLEGIRICWNLNRYAARGQRGERGHDDGRPAEQGQCKRGVAMSQGTLLPESLGRLPWSLSRAARRVQPAGTGEYCSWVGVKYGSFGGGGSMLNVLRLTALALGAFVATASAQTVGFATLPPGSILHAQASVIAKVVQDNSKLQVRVVGYGGDTGILEAV